MDSVAVVSDVHGNYPALQAVLRDIDAAGVSRIYCLGDLVGYYCMINEVIAALRERAVLSILGNHDEALAFRDGEIRRSRSATLALKRQAEYIAQGHLEYLRCLPSSVAFEVGEHSYYGVHGGLHDPLDEYLRDATPEYLEAHAFRHDVLLTGQTHVPVVVDCGRWTYGNPGAVGQPRDGDPRASYLLIDGGTLTIRRVPYDVDEIIGRMKAAGFPDALARNLDAGLGVGERHDGPSVG